MPIDRGPRRAGRDAELGDKESAGRRARRDRHALLPIDTSEQSVDEVKEIVRDTFGDKLQMFSVELGDAQAVQRRRLHRHRGRDHRQRRTRLRGRTMASATTRSSNWSSGAIESEGLTGIIVTVDNPELPAWQRCPPQGLERPARRRRRGGGRARPRPAGDRRRDRRRCSRWPTRSAAACRATCSSTRSKAIFVSLLGVVDLPLVAIPKGDLRSGGGRRPGARRAGHGRHDRDQQVHRRTPCQAWRRRCRSIRSRSI